MRPGCRLAQLRSQRGQTFTEYTMVLGLLTAIIVALTQIIIPGLASLVVGLVKHMLVCVSSIGP